MAHLQTKTGEDGLAEFLSALFRAFNNAVIDYAVARDYDSLPRGLEGRDIDILIGDADFERAYRLLLVVAGSHAAGVFKIDQEADTYAWAFVIHREEPSWGIHVDFLRSRCNNWRGCYFLDETDALKRKAPINGIYTLQTEDILFMQFCRDVVGNLHLREKYREPVANLYGSNPAGFEAKLARIFGRAGAARLGRICAQRDFANVAPLGRKLRRAIILRNLLSSPARAVRDTALYLAWRVREYLRPNGVMVVILGGQPGGNQALIEGARREIHRLVRSKIRAYRRSPGLLPALAASEKERPDGAPDLPNLFRIVYEALDCIFGYWLLVRRSLGRKCVAAVFDGYPYDDFADSRGWVRRSARLLARLMPRPDVIVRLPTQRATEESKRAGVELDRRLIARGAHVEKLAGYEDSPAVKEVVRIVFEALRRRLADSAESRSGRTIDARSANTADRMANAGANPDYELRAAHHE